MSRRDSSASEASFKSAQADVKAVRFSEAEEKALLEESNGEKAKGNKLFASSAFSEAIGEYDKALASCPSYLDYEVAVLKSNIAACHVKLEEWEEAAAAASKALDHLDRLVPKKQPKDAEQPDPSTSGGPSSERVVELDGDDDEAAEATLAALQMDDKRREQIRSLRAKSLMRRAKANVERGGWANLASAETDYKETLQLDVVPAADQKFIRKQVATLGPRIAAAKEQEMAEMMGKLKELGNGLLKPFGLSTDMFNFQKDEKTGGYNMSFGSGEGQG